MCGIAGVLWSDRHGTELLNALDHRGPDSRGWTDLGACSLGSTRLAILDTNQRADQPMTIGGTTIVLNGEIYNFAELRRELMAHGISFNTTGDTEVVLMAVRHWGLGALKRLRGMYAFLLWHAERQELWAGRDRFGIKPLYWGTMADDGVCFASEATALAELVGFKISTHAIAEFLNFGSPYSRTVFEGVTEIPPGTLTIWKRNRTIEVHPIEPAQSKMYAIRDQLADSVISHLVSDRPVALFLSGGVDSALIASVAATAPNKPVALTLDTGQNSDDIRFASCTAAHYGLRQHTIRYGDEDIRRRIQLFVDRMDQPTIDGFNSFLIADGANDLGFPVALSGLGGDEVLGGYGYYRRAQWAARAASGYNHLPKPLRWAIATLVAGRTGRVPSQVASIFEAETFSEKYRAWRCVFTPQEVERLTGTRPHDPVLILAEPTEDRQAFHTLDVELYLRNTLLRDIDVFSMACGVEVRVPLLDSAFFDLIFNGEVDLNKASVTKNLGDPFLQQIAARKKQAFRVPWDEWVKVLASPAEIISEIDPWSGLIDPQQARLLLTSNRKQTDRILSLIVLARWLQQLETPRRIARRPV